VTLRFVVEQAGCASCAKLVREALAGVGEVESIEIDESADVADVVLVSAAAVTVDELDGLLVAAGSGSGHAYRVRPGSLVAAASAR
jgi:copper chaperone CopZ